MLRRLFLLTGLSVGLSLLMTAIVRFRQEHRSWGVRPEDAARELPGDDIVADATIRETRSLEIDAPPAAVWPWLVQMGYGRAGWYSYDRMDMKGSSADRVLPEHQGLAVGDTMPAWPGGGFRVDVLEPERALVIYLDSAITARAGEQAAQAPAGGTQPKGLQAAGAMGGTAMPEFRATWAFVLDPLGEERTRLIERFRVWAPEAKGPQRMAMPFMGYGVFVMARKHMLGLKERAEREPFATGAAAPAADGPAPAAEPAPAV